MYLCTLLSDSLWGNKEKFKQTAPKKSKNQAINVIILCSSQTLIIKHHEIVTKYVYNTVRVGRIPKRHQAAGDILGEMRQVLASE